MSKTNRHKFREDFPRVKPKRFRPVEPIEDDTVYVIGKSFILNGNILTQEIKVRHLEPQIYAARIID